jgi:hypothetical protein
MPASCALPVTAELIARQNLPGGAKGFSYQPLKASTCTWQRTM